MTLGSQNDSLKAREYSFHNHLTQLHDSMNSADSMTSKQIHTSIGTNGLVKNDLWRTDPSLMVLAQELEDITNTEAGRFNPNLMKHDWHRTLLYQQIYTTGVVEFNPDGLDSMFITESEVVAKCRAFKVDDSVIKVDD